MSNKDATLLMSRPHPLFFHIFYWVHWLSVFTHLKIYVAALYAVVFGRLAYIAQNCLSFYIVADFHWYFL